jgi:hypothetical protein
MEVDDHPEVRLDLKTKLDVVIKILDEQEGRLVQQPAPPQSVQARTPIEIPKYGCPKAGEENYAAARSFSTSASIDNRSGNKKSDWRTMSKTERKWIGCVRANGEIGSWRGFE